MRLKCNGIEPTSIIYNGDEITHLKCNDIYVWGKPYVLNVICSDTNNIVNVNRISSPYENASIGSVTSQDAIYYGDILAVTTPDSGLELEVSVNGNSCQNISSIVVQGDIEITINILGWKTVWQGESLMSITSVVIDSNNMQPVYSSPILCGSNDKVNSYLSTYPFSKMKISGTAKFNNHVSIPNATTYPTVSFNDVIMPTTITSKGSISLNSWGSITGIIQTITGIICSTSDYSNTIVDSMVGNITETETFSSLTIEKIKIYYDKNDKGEVNE